MKKILFISLFDSVANRMGRMSRIADKFGDCAITFVTSDFNHGRKSYMPDSGKALGEVRLHVASYKKNLSLKRILSHIGFARQLSRYLKTLLEKPDMIYCAMPSSSAAYVAGKYCKKHDIPFVIDVIDLWPDSLIPIMPLKNLVKACLTPWRMLTHKAYKMADYISGESRKYSQVAHCINPDVPFSHTYLGVDKICIDQLIAESDVTLDKPNDEIWIGYGGSLGHSYDFDVILNGLRYLKEKNVRYKMWFIGDGDKADYIREIADAYGLNVVVTGYIAYKDLLKYLLYCDIAINSFKENTLVVHSYKFNDYVATGCYVLSNLPGETAEMIDKYAIGRNFNKDSFNRVLYETICKWGSIHANVYANLQRLIYEELDQATKYRELRDNIDNTILI